MGQKDGSLAIVATAGGSAAAGGAGGSAGGSGILSHAHVGGHFTMENHTYTVGGLHEWCSVICSTCVYEERG